jgi:hypothetical protein
MCKGELRSHAPVERGDDGGEGHRRAVHGPLSVATVSEGGGGAGGCVWGGVGIR